MIINYRFYRASDFVYLLHWKIFGKHSPATASFSFPHLGKRKSPIRTLAHITRKLLFYVLIGSRLSYLVNFFHVPRQSNEADCAFAIQGFDLASDLILTNVKRNEVLCIFEIQLYYTNRFPPGHTAVLVT